MEKEKTKDFNIFKKHIEALNKQIYPVFKLEANTLNFPNVKVFLFRRLVQGDEKRTYRTKSVGLFFYSGNFKHFIRDYPKLEKLFLIENFDEQLFVAVERFKTEIEVLKEIAKNYSHKINLNFSVEEIVHYIRKYPEEEIKEKGLI